MFAKNTCSQRIELVFFLLLATIYPALASDAKLDATQTALLDSVISTFHVEKCCGSSLKACLSKKEICPVAKHLYEFSIRIVQQDSDYDKIAEQLKKRYMGFVATSRHNIDTSHLQWAGSPDAPVRIAAYVSSTCNLCKHIVGALHDSVTVGSLKGKAKLMAIPFGKGIGDVALFAANSKGKFWQLFLEMKKSKIRYREDDVIKMAKEAGISEKEMKSLLKKPEFRQMVTKARAEGSENGVEVTPTFFINEKRYRSYKDPEWVVDAALFESEALR